MLTIKIVTNRNFQIQYTNNSQEFASRYVLFMIFKDIYTSATKVIVEFDVFIVFIICLTISAHVISH